jgi:hypothetical protein
MEHKKSWEALVDYWIFSSPKPALKAETLTVNVDLPELFLIVWIQIAAPFLDFWAMGSIWTERTESGLCISQSSLIYW